MLGIAIDVIVVIGNAKEVEAFTFRKSDDFAHRIVGRIAAVAGMKVEITLHPDPGSTGAETPWAWAVVAISMPQSIAFIFSQNFPKLVKNPWEALCHIQAKDLSVNGNPAATNTTSCATFAIR
jgi:hypothetical protein